MEEGARARWRQYREIWAYVEGDSCRRQAILRHFGDQSQPAVLRTHVDGEAAALGGERYSSPEARRCCDVCDPSLALAALPPPSAAAIGDLDDAIVSVARSARPAVGRTTCAEIVHGARTKKIERNSYDGLPAYGTSSHMRRADILARVDELIEAGRLRTTGGPYPVLLVAA